MKHFFRRNVVRMMSAAVVAVTAIAIIGTTSASAHALPSRVIVGMGDSFTSGEGAPPFYPNTNTATDKCHRSLVAYPLVAGALTHHTTARNVACSGAKTTDLFAIFKTEPAQVSRLAGATDIVLTIGGNDVDALAAVTNPPTPEEYAAKLHALAPALVSTYQEIHAAVPTAQIHVLGYPILFPAGAIAGCPLSEAQRTFLIAAENGLNQTIQGAAAYAGVQYVDDSAVFTGHELCTAHPWVNGFNTEHPEYQLHPNRAGQFALGVKAKQSL